MSYIPGSMIRKMGVFTPHEPRTTIEIPEGFSLSYGESFVGYDVRVEFDEIGEIEIMYLPPHSFELVSTIEYIKVPDMLVGSVRDKSTWGRRGLAVQNTVIEPGWEGHLTIEVTNHNNIGIDLRRGYPIAQIMFETIVSDPDMQTYSGKYQKQARGPVKAL